MNYSTFDKNNFYIKRDSTLPELKYPLLQWMKEKYDITDEMLENVAVTFSMIDANTGLFRIANVEANLIISEDRVNEPDEVKHTLMYRFKLPQTAKAGRYLADFTVDFLGDSCGKIKFPINGYINVIISDALTKTTVI